MSKLRIKWVEDSVEETDDIGASNSDAFRMPTDPFVPQRIALSDLSLSRWTPVVPLRTSVSEIPDLMSSSSIGAGMLIDFNWDSLCEDRLDDTFQFSETTSREAAAWEAQLSKSCDMAKGEPQRSFSYRFMSLVHETDFEFGSATLADEFLREAIHAYGPFAREWINALFLEHFGDPIVISAMLRVIGHIEYKDMHPQGMTMAAAALTHHDIDVRECGIRCFENWENPESVRILKHLSVSEKWLMEYLDCVISDLEGRVEHAASS